MVCVYLNMLFQFLFFHGMDIGTNWHIIGGVTVFPFDIHGVIRRRKYRLYF